MPNVMATLWIQVALSVENNQERKFRNSIFVPRPKIWLASTARVPCSNSASIGERKTWAQSEFCTWQNSVRDKSRQNCIYSVPAKETAKHRTKFGSVEWCRCNNEDNTWKPLKFAGVPKTRQSISAVSTPKFVILWGHVEEILLFKKVFPIVDTWLTCEDTALQSCAMAILWVITASCIFSEPHAAHLRHAF